MWLSVNKSKHAEFDKCQKNSLRWLAHWILPKISLDTWQAQYSCLCLELIKWINVKMLYLKQCEHVSLIDLTSWWLNWTILVLTSKSQMLNYKAITANKHNLCVPIDFGQNCLFYQIFCPKDIKHMSQNESFLCFILCGNRAL